jgi:hypothetical protein
MLIRITLFLYFSLFGLSALIDPHSVAQMMP